MTKRKRGDEGPLKAPLIAWMITDERRLKVLGEIFSWYGMSVYDYLKNLKRKGKI